MRDTWRRARFREVLTPAGEKVNVSDIDYVPYAGVRLNAGGVYAREVVPAKEVKARTLTRITKGHIVYNRMWATKGSFGVVDEEADGCLVTNDFPVFEADISHLLPGYCRLIFATPWFQFEAAARATGTTERRRLKEDAFLDIEVLLPSVEEQRRIVDLISSIDQAIREGQTLEQALNHLMRAVAVRSWASQTRVKLSEIGRLATGKTPSTKDKTLWEPAAVPFVTPGDLGQGLVLDSVERSVSLTGVAQSRTTEGWSVLQVCIGATIGKVAATERKVAFNQQINAVLELAELDAMYLTTVLSSSPGQSLIKGRTGQTAVPIVNKGTWGNLEVPWPAADQRRLIGSNARAIDSARTSVRSAVSDLGHFRAALLEELLKGKRAIPDSYDRFLEEAS